MLLWKFGAQNLKFARASHKAPKLFDGIAAEAEARASELSSQGLANIAWAFATAQHEAPSLFDAIAAESTRERLDESFRPQELANLAWAFATCGHAAIIAALADAGADLYASTAHNGSTALHLASSCGNWQATEQLVALDTSKRLLNAPTAHGATALHLAAHAASDAVIRACMAWGYTGTLAREGCPTAATCPVSYTHLTLPTKA